MSSMIGAKFSLKRDVLCNPAGAIGYCFNQYPDFDTPDATGVQVIFPNGEYDGFSIREQKEFLNFLGFDKRYTNYKFSNVIIVARDYEKGYWKFD
jgi:hypothetical protein